MSRKRSRRRRSLAWILLCTVTLLVLVFAHDVARSAHDVPAAQASSNQSFALLGNGLIDEENQVDSTLTSLLGHHSGVSRSQLFTQLSGLRTTLLAIPTQAQQLRHWSITSDLNTQLATWAVDRARAYNAVMAAVATSLQLPWPSGGVLTLSQADRILSTTTQRWDQRTSSLTSLPGHVVLNSFTNFSGLLNVGAITAQLDQSPQLQLRRSISMIAVAVTPAPFPAPPGHIELVSTSTISLGVSVLNGSFSSQPVTLEAVLTPTVGPPITLIRHGVLGPTQALAFTGLNFAVRPSEHASLQLHLLGAPATPGKSVDRSYQVVIASLMG